MLLRWITNIALALVRKIFCIFISCQCLIFSIVWTIGRHDEDFIVISSILSQENIILILANQLSSVFNSMTKLEIKRRMNGLNIMYIFSVAHSMSPERKNWPHVLISRNTSNVNKMMLNTRNRKMSLNTPFSHQSLRLNPMKKFFILCRRPSIQVSLEHMDIFRRYSFLSSFLNCILFTF